MLLIIHMINTVHTLYILYIYISFVSPPTLMVLFHRMVPALPAFVGFPLRIFGTSGLALFLEHFRQGPKRADAIPKR